MWKIWKKWQLSCREGKTKNSSRRNAVVQDIATAKRNRQGIFIHGVQDDRSVERRQRWSMWDTKEGREAVLNEKEVETEQKERTNTQDFVSASLERLVMQGPRQKKEKLREVHVKRVSASATGARAHRFSMNAPHSAFLFVRMLMPACVQEAVLPYSPS